MKLKHLFFGLLLFSVQLIAQTDVGIPSQAIPIGVKPKPKPFPEDKKPDQAPLQYTLSQPFEPTRYKSSPKFDPISNNIPMQIQGQRSDLNPGLVYEQQLNKQQRGAEKSRPTRGNQFLGEFKTGSDVIGIIYRDHETVDGDLVNILVNDHVVVYDVYLSGDFKELKLSLQKGFNKIEFQAVNMGDYAPNTAEFQVYDDKGILISSNQWNLSTGFKATIVIVKE